MMDTVEATVSHTFAVPAERVFDAWFDPDLVRLWMEQPVPGMGAMDIRRVEIDPRVGGRFTSSDMRADGEAVHWGYYHEIDRPRTLVFSWFTSVEEEAANTSLVTLTIEPRGAGCEATIVHRMSAKWAEYVTQTERGWSRMLGLIAAALEAEPARVGG